MQQHENATELGERGEPGLAMVDQERYVLSIDDAIERYKAAGIPRIRRTVQRYCANQTLDAHRFAIPYGEKYLITPESLERHIAYILQGDMAVVHHGEPRPTLPAHENGERNLGASPLDLSKPPAAGNDTDTAPNAIDVVEMLREENAFLKEQIAVKDAQLAVKDHQITDQSERVRETNLLIASLHKLITPVIDLGRRGDLHGSREDSILATDRHSKP